MPFSVTWINLETIMLSEGSQKEKDEYRVLMHIWTSLVAQMVKRLPTMQETRVQSLGQEGLLEKEMATHSSILAWKIPWMEEPVGYSPQNRKELDTTEQHHFTSLQ